MYGKGRANRNENSTKNNALCVLPFVPAVSQSESRPPAFDAVRSEARGPHWVAWVPDANGKPYRSVLLVGQTREEAEARARQWAAGQQAGR